MRNKLVSGASVQCRVNGVDIGTVISIQYQISTPREEDRGIDSLLPFEASPTVAQVTGTVQLYKVRKGGSLEAQGIANPMTNLDTEKYCSIQLVDRLTGAIYFSVAEAAIEGQTWSFAAKAVATGQFSFRGLVAKVDATR